MSYDRKYSFDEVARILDASEHRPRPDIPSSLGPEGHAIRLHTLERLDMFSRPKLRKGSGRLPRRDSTLLVSRNQLAAMVHEALNSPSGQQELAKLNDVGHQPARIRTVILRQGADFDVFTVYRPKGGQASFDWLSTTNGDGYIIQVLVIVYKIPNSTTNDIHIQTAFAEDFARTSGDNIVRPR